MPNSMKYLFYLRSNGLLLILSVWLLNTDVMVTVAELLNKLLIVSPDPYHVGLMITAWSKVRMAQ